MRISHKTSHVVYRTFKTFINFARDNETKKKSKSLLVLFYSISYFHDLFYPHNKLRSATLTGFLTRELHEDHKFLLQPCIIARYAVVGDYSKMKTVIRRCTRWKSVWRHIDVAEKVSVAMRTNFFIAFRSVSLSSRQLKSAVTRK